ncbi:EVE domain-containing protein [Eggerthellaceae bacterium zg-1084]|uniref:AAA family ATPase n=1 Tax=Berryella wangjianweii TaxID=2734634 RepID=UPI0015571F72|nr:AAA family ATPase [Berryella wangjianweii]NPD30385.1 EVE domain-containing protein [Berryella wangjianweii]
MIELSRFNEILALYKEDFASVTWGNEKYKWKAVKHFQDNWDINAPDFAEMLERALAKTYNLLASNNFFPKGMILELAKIVPEDTRAMFMALFDESRDYWERINEFKQRSNELVEQNALKGQSYQNENAITTYLWLRYPDRYYIYKYSEAHKTAEELGSNCVIKQGRYADNLRNHLALYDEVNAELRKDAELRQLLDSNLTPECYPDPEMRTLTFDFSFYITCYLPEHDQLDDEWWPDKDEYDPGLSVDDWAALLENREVFTASSLRIMKRLLDYGGAATCTQLAVKYGEAKNFYLNGSTALARRIAEKTSCPVMDRDAKSSRWWPILYVGRRANKDEGGSFVWRLRCELSEALSSADLSKVPLYASQGPVKGEHGYWWLNANPKIWSFSNIAAGEVQDYTLYNENGNKRRIFQNFLDAKAGDMVIGYESSPVKQVVAIVKISAEQDGERLYFEKVESLANPIDYKTLHDCPELERMEYFVNPQGSLFRLTPGEYDFILDLVREENPLPDERKSDHYDKAMFLEDVYMDDARYEQLRAILMHKKNVILQGAPGVGKTFCARRLAWSIMEEKDDNRIEFVQFHQNYSYEDFVMGYRPEGDTFELRYGIFYRFCQKAANQPDKPFFFIIDEINRGNMSKIFGELLMLIEADYRGTKVTLPYNGLPFSVPENLYIIGMMNTADRSLAMIDYALRRRFSFFDMEPGFDTKGFTKYREGLGSETIDELVDKVQGLNAAITCDKSLGKGFCIGHSYFCGRKAAEDEDEWGRQVVDFDIIPMLREYWFDDETKVTHWSNVLHGVFQ